MELKPIPGDFFIGYLAGSDGQIYSTKYSDVRLVTGVKNRNGYFRITCSSNNVHQNVSVHRLVCAAFNGQPPPGKTQVRHLDGNPSNNLPDNLKWGTGKENAEDRDLHGRTPTGERHYMSRLTDDQRDEIIKDIANGKETGSSAARKYGVSIACIFNLWKKRNGTSLIEVRRERFRGEDNPRSRLTADQVREIRRRYAAGGICHRELSEEYGVSKHTIHHIIHRLIWKSVT